jgi:pimeloyl-ACP methyl ester carboxylesterase
MKEENAMKENIVMIHGMWCGSWVWENYKRFFEEKGYNCYTPVLRHHDILPSDKPNPELGTTSLSDYVQDLVEYISKLDNDPVIIGHSMGGLLAQVLGARGLGKALVLLSPVSPAGINVSNYSVIKSVWRTFAKWRFWVKYHRISFKTAQYSMLHLLSKEEQNTIYDKFVYESGRASAEIGFWQFDGKGATKVDESKISCPVLVIAGSEDRVTPAIISHQVADKYSSVSKYKEFENHAHWVIGEDGWEEIAAYILDWIDGLN